MTNIIFLLCVCEILEPVFVRLVKNRLVIRRRYDNSSSLCATKKISIDQPVNEINCKVK